MKVAVVLIASLTCACTEVVGGAPFGGGCPSFDPNCIDIGAGGDNTVAGGSGLGTSGTGGSTGLGGSTGVAGSLGSGGSLLIPNPAPSLTPTTPNPISAPPQVPPLPPPSPPLGTSL